MLSKRVFVFGFFILAQWLACDSDFTPVNFDPDAFPAAPFAISLTVGDGIVALSWSHPKPGEVDFYKIYRRTNLDTSFAFIDTTAALEYTDTHVNNEVVYLYGVSAVRNDLEGNKTLSVNVVPTIFSVIINSQAEVTRSRMVVLTLVAPVTTTFMKISNDPAFGASAWEPYSATKGWTLSDGDGRKRVFVHYRDISGNQTLTAAQDSITLDTKATILSVTENTNGQVRSAGDRIRFTVITAEEGGSATIDLGFQRRGIRLFDDGTNGDDVENDGTYSRDFQVPQGLEVTNVNVVGQFNDRVGNSAESVEAPGRITIQNAPDPVILLSPENVAGSTTTLRLNWTRSNATDFSSYKLYRALSPGVTNSSGLVASIASASTVTHLDDTLQQNMTYYYRLYVFDAGGLSAASNEVSGTTGNNEPPDAVTLAQPDQTDSTTFRLSWTRSMADDFESYRIYRSEGAPVDLNEAPISILSTATTTMFENLDLQQGIEYHYQVLVFDLDGLSAASNEVMGQLK